MTTKVKRRLGAAALVPLLAMCLAACDIVPGGAFIKASGNRSVDVVGFGTACSSDETANVWTWSGRSDGKYVLAEVRSTGPDSVSGRIEIDGKAYRLRPDIGEGTVHRVAAWPNGALELDARMDASDRTSIDATVILRCLAYGTTEVTGAWTASLSGHLTACPAPGSHAQWSFEPPGPVSATGLFGGWGSHPDFGIWILWDPDGGLWLAETGNVGTLSWARDDEGLLTFSASLVNVADQNRSVEVTGTFHCPVAVP